VEERGSLRLAGTLCFHVAEAAEIEHSRGPTSGTSRQHRACRYTASRGIFARNRHWSRDNHSRRPADSTCEAGDCRPVMDGIARRFGLGASEHRDEVSEASIPACQGHPETSVRWRLLAAPHEYANYRFSRLCNPSRQQSNGRLSFSSGPMGPGGDDKWP
jgi:hypothetical protein